MNNIKIQTGYVYCTKSSQNLLWCQNESSGLLSHGGWLIKIKHSQELPGKQFLRDFQLGRQLLEQLTYFHPSLQPSLDFFSLCASAMSVIILGLCKRHPLIPAHTMKSQGLCLYFLQLNYNFIGDFSNCKTSKCRSWGNKFKKYKQSTTNTIYKKTGL